jgi:hypothetical protein
MEGKSRFISFVFSMARLMLCFRLCKQALRTAARFWARYGQISNTA